MIRAQGRQQEGLFTLSYLNNFSIETFKLAATRFKQQQKQKKNFDYI